MHKNSEVVRELTLMLEVKEQIKRKEKNYRGEREGNRIRYLEGEESCKFSSIWN